MTLSTRSPLRLVRPEQLPLGRTAVGVLLLARPRTLPDLLGVDRGNATQLTWALQMLGAREVALGVGALIAPRSDRALWLGAGLFSDAVDACVVAAAVGRGHARPLPGAAVVGIAVGAVVVQAVGLAGRRR